MKVLLTIVKILVPVLIIGVLVYYLAIVTQQRQIEKQQALLEAQQERVSRLQREMEKLPLLPPEERNLWHALDERTREILFDEENMIRALASLATLANQSGASLSAISIEDPTKVSAASAAPSARPRVVRPPNADVEELLPLPADIPLVTRARQGRPSVEPPPSPAGENISDLDALDAARAAQKLGNTEIGDVPVRLAVRGSYASWTRFLAALSRRMAPIRIDQIHTQNTDDEQLMILSVRVPVRHGGPGPDSLPASAGDIRLPQSVARLYGLDALSAGYGAGYVSLENDPFPVRAPVIVAREPLPAPDWTLTAVIQRDGGYVAVVNNDFWEVGQVRDGRRLVRITGDAAIFTRDDQP